MGYIRKLCYTLGGMLKSLICIIIFFHTKRIKSIKNVSKNHQRDLIYEWPLNFHIFYSLHRHPEVNVLSSFFNFFFLLKFTAHVFVSFLFWLFSHTASTFRLKNSWEQFDFLATFKFFLIKSKQKEKYRKSRKNI